MWSWSFGVVVIVVVEFSGKNLEFENLNWRDKKGRN